MVETNSRGRPQLVNEADAPLGDQAAHADQRSGRDRVAPAGTPRSPSRSIPWNAVVASGVAIALFLWQRRENRASWAREMQDREGDRALQQRQIDAIAENSQEQMRARLVARRGFAPRPAAVQPEREVQLAILNVGRSAAWDIRIQLIDENEVVRAEREVHAPLLAEDVALWTFNVDARGCTLRPRAAWQDDIGPAGRDLPLEIYV